MVPDKKETANSSESIHEEQIQQLVALGRLAGTVAHELNNPLDGILRYLNLAIRVIEQGEANKALDYLQQSRDGLMRMVRITRQLLTYTRSLKASPETATLDEILNQALRIIQPIGGDIEIVLDRQLDGTARYPAAGLTQVFINLIKNAVDAMSGRGRLTITIHADQDNLTVAFRDSGPGFAPEDSEKLFQPFYTTKPDGHGTGLGLAICRDLIEKLKGHIIATNNPDGGSTFTVQLPYVNTSGQERGVVDHE
ncbi:MAG: HAMP domain-containing histidine kinase [Sedimentisphaerales bacterium]|nr:HAMP domain-containing histidine kinase [Sedimentisphaerales bacterium]